jgi:hypothetical protein
MPEVPRDKFVRLPYDANLGSCEYFISNIPGHEEIERASYFRWLQLGKPEAQELDIWLYAKELVFRNHGRKME